MFTLDDSIRNLCTYISNNLHLLPSNYEVDMDYKVVASDYDLHSGIHILIDDVDPNQLTQIILISESESLRIAVFEDKVTLFYKTESDVEHFYEFIKIFNIPDFHIIYSKEFDNLLVGYDVYLVRYGKRDPYTIYRIDVDTIPLIDKYQMRYLHHTDKRQLNMFEYRYFNERYLNISDMALDEEDIEKLKNDTNIVGIIITDDMFGRYKTLEYIKSNIGTIFKTKPTLQYIWIDNIEYSRHNETEYDYKLRVAELECRNELLEDKKRFCVYFKNYSKH